MKCFIGIFGTYTYVKSVQIKNWGGGGLKEYTIEYYESKLLGNGLEFDFFVWLCHELSLQETFLIGVSKDPT